MYDRRIEKDVGNRLANLEEKVEKWEKAFQLEEQNSQINQLKLERSFQSKELGGRDAKIERQRDEINRLKQELLLSKSQFADLKANLEKEIENKDDRIRFLNHSLESAQSWNKECLDQKDALQKQIDEKHLELPVDEQIEILRRNIKTNVDDARSYAAECEWLKGDAKHLKKEISGKDERIEYLQKSLKSAQSWNREYLEQREQLHQQIDEKKSELKIARELIEELKKR